MGLRHRTPSSMIREYRRRAALGQYGQQKQSAVNPSKKRRSPLQFRSLEDWEGSTSVAGVGSQGQALDGRETPQMLLDRLRDMLAPGSSPAITSSHIECQSLEEEIGRIVQITRSSDKAPRTETEGLLREVFIPHGPQKTIDPETAPYRSIQLDLKANKLGIVKLTESLSDLSFFLLPKERTVPSPSLTLVSNASESPDVPGPQELGAETASVMQQLLEAAKKKSQAISHPKTLIISLLD